MAGSTHITHCGKNEVNSSLERLVEAGAIPSAQALSATAWAADVVLLAPPSRGRQPRRRPQPGGPRPPCIMRAAGKRRCRKVEDKLAGVTSMWFRSAYLVAVKGMAAVAAAEAMGLALPTFLGILRPALADIHLIYSGADRGLA